MRNSMFLLCALTLTATSAQAQTLAAHIDQGLRVALPVGAQNVMIGNPSIADVNLLDSRNAVLLGRSYGVTNLLVLDARGRTLMDRQVVVSAPDLNRVSMYRGNHNLAGDSGGLYVQNFACSPRCERTPMPGETDTQTNTYSAAYVNYALRTNEGRNTGPAKVGP